MNFTEDIEELRKVINDYGTTVAHEQAKNGWTTGDPDILKLSDNYGWTVAHTQASKGWTTEDPDILKLSDNYGWAVAHEQVFYEWTTEDPEILKLANDGGWTVLSLILKKSNWIPSENLKDIKIDGKTIWEHYADKQLELL